MKRISRFWPVWVFLIFITYGCGVDLPDTFQSRGLVCKNPGFCLLHNDGTNFYGAYQKDGQEVQFKVHYRHWEPTELILERSRYSSCMMTEKQIPINSGSMKCPQNPDPHYDESINLRDYNPILHEFHDYLITTPHPEGRKGEWEKLIKMIEATLP